MTTSDRLMIASVRMRVPFRINGREVCMDGDVATISLLGQKTAAIDFLAREVTVFGVTMVTRKSARVINAVLREFTQFHFVSADGQCLLCDRTGIVVPTGRLEVRIPMAETGNHSLGEPIPPEGWPDDPLRV